MKLIIAGSRDIEVTTAQIQEYVDASGFFPSCIVSGKARGVDSCGEYWAKGKNLPIMPFPADWDKHGKAAGPIRNKHMADVGDALLLIWDGT